MFIKSCSIQCLPYLTKKYPGQADEAQDPGVNLNDRPAMQQNLSQDRGIVQMKRKHGHPLT